MNSFKIAALTVVLLSVVYMTIGQEDPTTEPPLDGQPYGAACNGLLNQCHRYSETVVCLSRTYNASVGGETCNTGPAVLLAGRCQCRRNCAVNGVYQIDGEFDEARQKCVGFVGKSCGINPDCTANASCNLVTRICNCNAGFRPDADGLKCIPA